MPLRLYMADIVGDGLTIETAFRSAADVLLASDRTQGPRLVDAKMGFALHVLDLAQADHDMLVNSGQVRAWDVSVLQLTRAELSAAQLSALNDLLTQAGYTRASTVFTPQAKIIDLLRWMRGHMDWDGERRLGL